MAGNFTQVAAPDFFYLGLHGWLLRQDDLAGDVFHIPVTQHDLDWKAALDALQTGGAGQSRLTGAHKQQLATEVLAQAFCDFLYLVSLVGIGANVLLHLVQHHQGQGELAVCGQRRRNGGDHLLVSDVRHLRKLGFNEQAGFGIGFGKLRTGLQQCFGQVAGDVHVRQLLGHRPTVGLELGLDGIQQALTL